LIIMNEKLIDIIQDCNLNFLIGSGLSSPYLKTLGNIETLLTQLEAIEMNHDKKKIIKASLYKKYFDEAISKNTKILESSDDAKDVLNNYYDFLKFINIILLKRKSTILSKEVNIFTTNMDIFLEKALENLNLEYNDGFNGRFKPTFSLSNFKKSHFKKSLHYDNKSELPVFNLLKLHGSLTWHLQEDESIVFAADLNQVKKIQIIDIPEGNVIRIGDNISIEKILSDWNEKTTDPLVDTFLAEYEKLLIVNPTKEKFKHTILNHTYYELLRIYSNELEKENTILLVMGFSFADEHIREITLRAANSNPTLMIYIISFSSEAKAEIEARFIPNCIRNDNIEIIAPPQKNTDCSQPIEDKYKFDLSMINKEIFGKFFDKEKIDDRPIEIEEDDSR
jgi:hypothetical protein